MALPINESQGSTGTHAHSSGVVAVDICYGGAMPLPLPAIATCDGTAYQQESQLDRHTRAHLSGVMMVCICYDGAMPLPLPAIATCDGTACH